jgi:LacI family transcriptional regulator
MKSGPAEAPDLAARAAMRDVAAQAGVSIATVSRVLNGRPDVARTTRDRVLHEVRSLGYVSNRGARALAGRRTGLIGIVVPFSHSGYFSPIVEGAAEALYARDARLVLCPTGHQHDRECSMLDRLLGGDTDGTLLITPMESAAELRQLCRHGAPIVVIDPTRPLDEDIPVVAGANWSGGRVATEHLIALGHRRIAVITGTLGWSACSDRVAGYHSAMLAADLPLLPEYLIESDFQEAGGAAAARRLLALPTPPTAIFAFNDLMALGAMRTARQFGLSVPDDLSLVGFDNIDLACVTSPELTSVSQPLQEMGRLGATMLYRQIDGQRLDAYRVELSTRLIIRASTAPPRDRR